MRPEIVVDLAAIRHNARTLAALVAPAALMTVVKADGYGHGIVESARAARAGGATWLGVATVSEALALRDAARTYDAVVLLKGRRTVVARPDGRARVTTTGVPWLATAGAGDVLAGLIGALLAAGLEPFDAASVGSWLHGAAATHASQGGPLTAPDVARAIPAVVRDLL